MTMNLAVRQCGACMSYYAELMKSCPKCGVSRDAPMPIHGELSEMAEKGQESRLQREVEAWLTYRQIEFLHLSPRAREKPGWPDLVFAIGGSAVAIELKTAAGRVTQAQSDCHDRLRKNGWAVHVCRSLDEVREFVNAVSEENENDM